MVEIHSASNHTGDCQQAKRIRAYRCQFCPAVHIDLINENDKIFATATLPLESVESFIARLREVSANCG